MEEKGRGEAEGEVEGEVEERRREGERRDGGRRGGVGGIQNLNPTILWRMGYICATELPFVIIFLILLEKFFC